MPTLLLTPRYTDDSRLLRSAALRAGWDVFRLGQWRVPEEPAVGDLVFYGEPLLADVEVILVRLGTVSSAGSAA